MQLNLTECFNCGKFGHKAKDCWHAKRGNEAAAQQPAGKRRRVGGKSLPWMRAPEPPTEA